MKYKQCSISSQEKGTVTLRCVFLEANKVKKGYFITLEDDKDTKRLWKIEEVFEPAVPVEHIKDAHSSENWYKKDWLHKMEPKKKK